MFQIYRVQNCPLKLIEYSSSPQHETPLDVLLHLFSQMIHVGLYMIKDTESC